MHEADFINEYSEDLNDFSEDSKNKLLTEENFEEENIKHKLDLEEILRVYNEYLKATKDKPKNYTTTVTGTGENIVDRDYLDKAMKKSNINYNYGWICPRCGKVLAPDIKECTCKPEPKSNTNDFYHQVFKSGYCSTGRKYTQCPEKPNYDSCHFCSNWIEIKPL